MKPCIAVLWTIGIAATALAQELPPPPAGFAWQPLPEIKGALLRPDGWFFKKDKKGTTLGYFISKENIDAEGSFRTGLTFECLVDVARKSGMAPSAYIKKLADAAAAKHELLERRAFHQGPFESVRFRYISAPAGEASQTVLQLLIANDRTGTVFLAIFESPTATWEPDYRIGETILKKMLIDDAL